jgi:hypothetical protein
MSARFITTDVQDWPPTADNPYWQKKITQVKCVCKSCRWMDNDSFSGNVCKRHAPITHAGRNGNRLWPYVEESDWCGDWEGQ